MRIQWKLKVFIYFMVFWLGRVDSKMVWQMIAEPLILRAELKRYIYPQMNIVCRTYPKFKVAQAIPNLPGPQLNQCMDLTLKCISF